MGEEIIIGSRARASILGAISFLIAIAALGVAQGDLQIAPPLVGWIGVIVFGALGVPIFASMAYRPRQLILRPEGLTLVTSFAQKVEIRWQDVEDFFVWKPSGTSLVAYRLHDPSHSHLNRAHAAIGTVGGSWHIGTEQVVERLNRYREDALANR